MHTGHRLPRPSATETLCGLPMSTVRAEGDRAFAMDHQFARVTCFKCRELQREKWAQRYQETCERIERAKQLRCPTCGINQKEFEADDECNYCRSARERGEALPGRTL